jgi:hypothetical protein
MADVQSQGITCANPASTLKAEHADTILRESFHVGIRDGTSSPFVSAAQAECTISGNISAGERMQIKGRRFFPAAGKEAGKNFSSHARRGAAARLRKATVSFRRRQFVARGTISGNYRFGFCRPITLPSNGGWRLRARSQGNFRQVANRPSADGRAGAILREFFGA